MFDRVLNAPHYCCADKCDLISFVVSFKVSFFKWELNCSTMTETAYLWWNLIAKKCTPTDLRIRSVRFSLQFLLNHLQSWTKGCKQISDIKQKRFLYGISCGWFLRVFNENVKIWLLGVRLGARHQIHAFQEFSWNFLVS